MRTPFSAAGATSIGPPVTMPSSNTQSATLRVIGPAVSRVCEIGTMPACDQRPVVGRRPTIPHSAAGMRTDPPVSEPIPPGRNPRRNRDAGAAA